MKQFFILLCILFMVSCDPPTETSSETVTSTTVENQTEENSGNTTNSKEAVDSNIK